MEIIRELKKFEHTCLGLGFFDGVHKGHIELLEKLINISKKNNKKSVVITFLKSPAEKFIKKEDVNYLTTLKEKEDILSELEIDYLVELDFNDNLMNMTAGEYIEKVLYNYFKPDYIISGFNHTFGKDKSGTPDILRKYQNKFNYNYIEMPEVKINNETVSSTLIRNELVSGNMQKVTKFLGYPFKISGTVIKGNQIGRTIGFPTANIDYPKEKVKMPFGVYSTNVTVKGKTYKGMLNYGIKPTINKECKPVAEVHIIEFNNDIYGENIQIEILDKIRDEKKFNSLEELKQQITKDIQKC